MAGGDALQRGRAAYSERSWSEAYLQLRAADSETPLAAEDLARLAIATDLLGKADESADAWARAYHACLTTEPARAARYAFWAGMGLLNRGEFARGGGWLARAQRALDDAELDECAERGLLLVAAAVPTMDSDAAAALNLFQRAYDIAEHCRDPDLATLARLGRGRSLALLGRTHEAIAMLDEVMVAVTAHEVSPIVVGIAYCAAIDACQSIFQMGRAQEWTSALTRWCDSQPNLVPFRGQCLVHRAQILQLHGDWTAAMDQAERAGAALGDAAAVGSAYYERGELHRLRGELDLAERAYEQAGDSGRTPQPGASLLLLAQGRIDAADKTIRRAVEDAEGWPRRSQLLPAYVEIVLAAGDVPAARAGAEELRRLAADLDSPYLRAVAAYALGAVALVDGDARAALPMLRDAWTAWCELDVPYEAARTRVLLSRAARDLGEDDTAAAELAAARRAFTTLGAAPALAAAERLDDAAGAEVPGGLTGREVEVLGHVATGKTNREIASALVISEKTVARHVSNIFAKLGVASRAAATAYAYQHDIV